MKIQSIINHPLFDIKEMDKRKRYLNFIQV